MRIYIFAFFSNAILCYRTFTFITDRFNHSIESGRVSPGSVLAKCALLSPICLSSNLRVIRDSSCLFKCGFSN